MPHTLETTTCDWQGDDLYVVINKVLKAALTTFDEVKKSMLLKNKKKKKSAEKMKQCKRNQMKILELMDIFIHKILIKNKLSK